jgi:hypothetical protein
VVAVPDDERERRPERPPVPEAGEDFDRIRLDPLTRAPPVAHLAAAQIDLDRFALEDEPSG